MYFYMCIILGPSAFLKIHKYTLKHFTKVGSALYTLHSVNAKSFAAECNPALFAPNLTLL